MNEHRIPFDQIVFKGATGPLPGGKPEQNNLCPLNDGPELVDGPDASVLYSPYSFRFSFTLSLSLTLFKQPSMEPNWVGASSRRFSV